MTATSSRKQDPCFSLDTAEQTSYAPLSECVEKALKDYFEQLKGHSAANLYEMLLAEVEAPLLKATLEYTNGNQSRAAEILGLNRGTLRRKLKTYGL